MTYAKVFLIVFVGCFFCATLLFAQTAKPVPYPAGFRNWTHVKTDFSAPSGPRQGIHNIYANDKAMEGFRTGRFTNGSVIAFDLLGTASKDGVTYITERRLVDVMQKDDKRFAETGGWGFDEFRGDSPTGTIGETAVASCFNCHSGQKDSGFVFSKFRE